MDAELFWKRFLAETGRDPNSKYLECFHFDLNERSANALLALVLDGKKREAFNKFDNLEDQLDRDFDEYELESEKAGPVFQLIARYAF